MDPPVENERWKNYQVSRPCDAYGNQTNHLSNDPGGACMWRGSVDVEDLALGFPSVEKTPPYGRKSKIQHTRHHRVFRASSNIMSRVLSSPVAYEFGNRFYGNFGNGCYDGCGVLDTHENQCDDFIGVASTSSMSIDNNFGVPCTEAQWLACPITHCPALGNVT